MVRIESWHQGKESAQREYSGIYNTIHQVGMNIKRPIFQDYLRLIKRLDELDMEIAEGTLVLQSIIASPRKEEEPQKIKKNFKVEQPIGLAR